MKSACIDSKGTSPSRKVERKWFSLAKKNKLKSLKRIM